MVGYCHRFSLYYHRRRIPSMVGFCHGGNVLPIVAIIFIVTIIVIIIIIVIVLTIIIIQKNRVDGYLVELHHKRDGVHNDEEQDQVFERSRRDQSPHLKPAKQYFIVCGRSPSSKGISLSDH